MRRLLPFLLIASASCGDIALTPKSDNYGAISVEAVDEEGSPVAAVSAALFTPGRRIAMATTAVDGSTTFDFVAPGEYKLFFQAAPFTLIAADQQNPISDVRVERGRLTPMTVRIVTRLGEVEVLAVDTLEAPVPDVGLELSSSAGVDAVGTTDEEGIAVLESIATGTYKLLVLAPPGWVVPSMQPNPILDLVIEEDQATEVTLVLEASG
ncbi:MAG: hypothetical protein GEU90_10790 [Gemmatimonas sp.]|nr:hypothetical protein [Gemmatimonas sp.]